LPGIIDQLLVNSDIDKSELKAVAVSQGPGSYTGLRIGYSTAKGLCYGLNIPLVGIPTLDIMIEEVRCYADGETLLCAMLDARRMEVYAKILDVNGNLILDTSSVIIEENTFKKFHQGELWLFGNGSSKCEGVINHPNYKIIDSVFPNSVYMGKLAHSKFMKGEFEDIAYGEPIYLKEFQVKKAKNKLVE
jgi:tRNA threonylcarbamoyladenosine biosynthesis protein TsaB